jgi:ribosomal protein L33
LCLRKQSRETGNIGYTRRRQTIQRNWQHWIHKTQDEGKQSRETGNIGYTRHKTKANNPEKLATLGTQDERQTIQRNWQHWVHKTNGKQYRETGNIGYTRHKTKANNPEKLVTLDTQDEGKQSRETGNIGYTRHKTKANKSKTQHNIRWTPLCASKLK